jgi:hypothetical protein
VADDELEAINDRKTMAERVAALCGVWLAVEQECGASVSGTEVRALVVDG